MVALVDKWADEEKLPKRARLVAVARWFIGNPYEWDGKDAKPLDGLSFGGPRKELKPLDCSGLVCAVYNAVYGEPRIDMDTAVLLTTTVFQTVTEPGLGDIICWSGHCAIVADLAKKICIHAPGAHKLVKTQDWTYMGLGTPAFRTWNWPGTSL
jgi:hypothetical protein